MTKALPFFSFLQKSTLWVTSLNWGHYPKQRNTWNTEVKQEQSSSPITLTWTTWNSCNCDRLSKATYCQMFATRHGLWINNCTYTILITCELNIVVFWSKAWKVFACSNTGIVGFNLTQDMDVCVQVAALRADHLSKSFTGCLTLRNWSETKHFTNSLCSKWEQQE
jgi:hypothetical protein